MNASGASVQALNIIDGSQKRAFIWKDCSEKLNVVRQNDFLKLASRHIYHYYLRHQRFAKTHHLYLFFYNLTASEV